jgi:methyl-accepting chemotaxis protein
MISMYVLASLTLTSVLLLVFLVRFISRPLNSLSAELDNITESTDRLTGAIDNNTFDQQANIDDITAYINKTAENIRDILNARRGQ